MKRSEALAALSRDHHQGLFAAMKLKRADDEASALAARGTFLEFWETGGRRHFRVEEELLLPSWARHGAADHPAVVQVLVEHVDLRRRGADLAAGEPALEDLHELGERLERHIRHEERVLFPLIEEALPEDELAELARAIADA